MNDTQRTHSPFEDSAAERLRRMGLTAADGSPERDAMTVFSSIFAGQFFDDLCDYCQDFENVQAMIDQIFHTAEQADPRQKFLQVRDWLENDRRPNLTIIKRDADTGEAVPGTVFEVRFADGHSVQDVTTGPDGKGHLENLLA